MTSIFHAAKTLLGLLIIVALGFGMVGVAQAQYQSAKGAGFYGYRLSGVSHSAHSARAPQHMMRRVHNRHFKHHAHR